MILIKNTQRIYPINTKKVTSIVQKILDDLGYADFDIGIWFTTNKTIARYNQAYRRKTGPTDILSFPYWPTLKAGQKIIAKNKDEANLGDIIISLEYIESSAQWQSVAHEERLPRLLVHGICHLLGYDHETDADYKIMHKKERELLKLVLYTRE